MPIIKDEGGFHERDREHPPADLTDVALPHGSRVLYPIDKKLPEGRLLLSFIQNADHTCYRLWRHQGIYLA